MYEINLGIITSSFIPAVGGVEISLYNLSNSLISKNIKPIIFVPFAHFQNIKRNKIKLPYQVIALPPKFFSFLDISPRFFFYFSNLYIKKLTLKYKIDAWHGLFGYPVGVMLGNYVQINKPNNIPCSCRCVGEDIQIDKNINYGVRISSKINKIFEDKITKLDFLVASSETIKKEYLNLKISENKIKLIPNPVDLEKFKKKRQRNKTSFNFLCLGRYHKKKNFELIIKSINSMNKLWLLKKKIFFYFVGYNISLLKKHINDENSNFIKVFDTKNINQNFSDFPSHEIIEFYRLADCFLMPSSIESFGNVLTEAMASNLPIISAESKGCVDVLKNGKYGIIVKNNNPKEFNFYIKKIVDDKVLRTRLIKLSRKRAQHFSLTRITNEYANFFKTLANVKK